MKKIIWSVVITALVMLLAFWLLYSYLSHNKQNDLNVQENDSQIQEMEEKIVGLEKQIQDLENDKSEKEKLDNKDKEEAEMSIYPELPQEPFTKDSCEKFISEYSCEEGTLTSQGLVDCNPLYQRNSTRCSAYLEGKPDPYGDNYGIEEIVSEESLGYIKSVYKKDGNNYLDIDYIQRLVWDKAISVATEDGNCEYGCVENGYYIRNQNPKIRTFIISKDVDIKLQTKSWDRDGSFNRNEEVDYVEFEEFWIENKDLPFDVKIFDNEVVEIIEQYIP